MTIRSWAGAGALALASALVFGWGAGSALAKPADPADASSNASYPLSLRGNAGDYSFSSDEGCTYCNVDDCSCLFMESGSFTNWTWGTNPWAAIDYQIEVDYLLDYSTDSGTGGSCATAVGGISLDASFTPNVLVAETTGTICDTYDGNLTYTGSYVVLDNGAGLFTDASGSGALTFGIANTIDESAAHNSSQQTYGQLQMTGNLSLTTAAPTCSGIGGAGADC